ncbi:ATP-binding protein [Cellulosilyticum ruminicola]|uniref:ATP-binding protein n=1 Tax=Cellulosilyticum ruminicola TaxID=425254 RepID=UPI0006D28270|nr:ATP-binding protein [Cellulosilyticum ruminicola]
MSELSGRGVGTDVVVKNIETMGVSASMIGKGSTFTIRIPLTMVIIDGMHIRVGETSYTLPTMAIRESFRLYKQQIITGVEGNEMIIVRV